MFQSTFGQGLIRYTINLPYCASSSQWDDGSGSRIGKEGILPRAPAIENPNTL